MDEEYYKVATQQEASLLGGIIPTDIDDQRNLRSTADEEDVSNKQLQYTHWRRPEIEKFGCGLKPSDLTRVYDKNIIHGYCDVNYVDLQLQFTFNANYKQIKFRIKDHDILCPYSYPVATNMYNNWPAMLDTYENIEVKKEIIDVYGFEATYGYPWGTYSTELGKDVYPYDVWSSYLHKRYDSYDGLDDDRYSIGYMQDSDAEYSKNNYHASDFWWIYDDECYCGRWVNFDTGHPIYALITTDTLTDYPLFFGCYAEKHKSKVQPEYTPTYSPTSKCVNWVARLSDSTRIGIIKSNYGYFDHDSYAVNNILSQDNQWALTITSFLDNSISSIDIKSMSISGEPSVHGSPDTDSDFWEKRLSNSAQGQYMLQIGDEEIIRNSRGDNAIIQRGQSKILTEACYYAHFTDPNRIKMNVRTSSPSELQAWVFEGGFTRTTDLSMTFNVPTNYIQTSFIPKDYFNTTFKEPCCSYKADGGGGRTVPNQEEVEGFYCIAPFFDFIFLMDDGSVIKVENVKMLPRNIGFEESQGWDPNARRIPRQGVTCDGQFVVPFDDDSYRHEYPWDTTVACGGTVYRHNKYFAPSNDTFFLQVGGPDGANKDSDDYKALNFQFNGRQLNVIELLEESHQCTPAHNFQFDHNSVTYGLPKRHQHPTDENSWPSYIPHWPTFPPSGAPGFRPDPPPDDDDEKKRSLPSWLLKLSLKLQQLFGKLFNTRDWTSESEWSDGSHEITEEGNSNIVIVFNPATGSLSAYDKRTGDPLEVTNNPGYTDDRGNYHHPSHDVIDNDGDRVQSFDDITVDYWRNFIVNQQNDIEQQQAEITSNVYD